VCAEQLCAAKCTVQEASAATELMTEFLREMAVTNPTARAITESMDRRIDQRMLGPLIQALKLCTKPDEDQRDPKAAIKFMAGMLERVKSVHVSEVTTEDDAATTGNERATALNKTMEERFQQRMNESSVIEAGQSASTNEKI
jgi:hypothetical protein